MSAATLDDLADLPKRFPELKELDFSRIVPFMRDCCALRDKGIILPSTHDNTSAPPRLSSHQSAVFSKAKGIDVHHVDILWDALKDEIWCMPLYGEVVDAFENTGWERGITYISHYPPSRLCTNPECDYEELRDHTTAFAVTFTNEHGAQYSKVVHLICPKCRHNYRNNFYIGDQSRTRYYYQGVPDYIQIGENHYVEKHLAEMWTKKMLVSPAMASNTVDVYQKTRAVQQDQTQSSTSFSIPFRTTLTAEDVWNAIFILALLRDHRPHGRSLSMPHGSEDEFTFDHAIRERNERFERFGQPELRHHCDDCIRLYETCSTKTGCNGEGKHTVWKTQVALTECGEAVDQVVTMRPCGIVLYRSTLDPGADDIASALASAKGTFELFGAQKPEFWMYSKHVAAGPRAELDAWWDSVQIMCPHGCRSDDYPELLSVDGKALYFKTSDTGMKVVRWLESYREIVDGMSPARYCFFLDEMVRLRNANLVRSLRGKGRGPNYTPIGGGYCKIAPPQFTLGYS